MYGGFNNPFLPGAQYAQAYNHMMPQAAPVQVVRVNGSNGANAYAIGPNSSALLLDESGTLVWLVTTDGAGYKTVSPYDITPHKDAPAPDLGSLESRIARLEGLIDEYSADTAAAKRRKPDPEPAAG